MHRRPIGMMRVSRFTRGALCSQRQQTFLYVFILRASEAAKQILFLVPSICVSLSVRTVTEKLLTGN